MATCLHDGRALATQNIGHSSMPRSPLSSKAAISTSSASTRSDAKHILLLTSSLIPRRFWNSTFSMHSCHPSACTRTIRSRATRLGHGETMPRFSHSPRASALLQYNRVVEYRALDRYFWKERNMATSQPLTRSPVRNPKARPTRPHGRRPPPPPFRRPSLFVAPSTFGPTHTTN